MFNQPNISSFYPFFQNLPFGETMVELGGIDYDNPYKFNGKELDPETGNYYYGARYYNPKVSQWLSVDPLAEKYAGFSPYNYTLNNPVMLVDPDGKKVNDEWIVGTNGNKKKISNRGGDEVQYIHYTKDHPFSGNTMIALGNSETGMKYVEMLKTSDVKINPAGENYDYSDSNYLDNRVIHTYYNNGRKSAFHPITQKERKNFHYYGYINTNNIFFDILTFRGTLKLFGPSKQWLRTGSSYSKKLGRKTISVRWGASPARNGKYIKQIPNLRLRQFNQWLRNKKIPGNSWRVIDRGHFHIIIKK